MKTKVATLILLMATMLPLLFGNNLTAAAPTKTKPKKPTATTVRQEAKLNQNEAIVNRRQGPSNNAAANTTRLTGEQIKWQVISSGGGRGTAGNFILSATVGQTAVGSGSSDNFGLTHGFQQNFGEPPPTSCCVIRGDVDHSGGVDVSDLTYLVDYLFGGGPSPVCDESGYYAEADVNNSGGVDVSDLTYIVDYLFGGGPPPVPC